MEHDERDRRDPEGDADSTPPAAPRPDEPRSDTSPADEPAWPSEPTVPPTDVTSDASTDAPADAPAPQPDWGAASAIPAETPDAAPPPPPAEPAWPTEPPAAGTGADDTWPTAAPERADEPMADDRDAVAPPSDAAGAHEAPTPPPSEVEAYPAAPADDRPSGAEPVAAAAATSAHAVPAGESATGESTQCPRCGTENRPGLAFCRTCGQRLVAAGVASTVERPGTPEGTQACPRCGTHNRAGVGFCQNCGANLRGTAPGYVPPAVTEEAADAPARVGGTAVLGPVVLIIGLVGIVTGYLLPFAGSGGSLFERAMGAGGYGVAFWNGYPEVNAALADQAYFGLAAPTPLFGLLLLVLAVAGFARAVPGMLQGIGLAVALLWSVGLAVLFVVVELAANWGGDLVALLRDVSPAGIIFFLASLIVLIGTLTRFGRS